MLWVNLMKRLLKKFAWVIAILIAFFLGYGAGNDPSDFLVKQAQFLIDDHNWAARSLDCSLKPGTPSSTRPQMTDYGIDTLQ